MNRPRSTAGTTALVTAVLGLALLSPSPAHAQSQAADPAYPTGTYAMGHGGWMSQEDICFMAYGTGLTELSISDDTTPTADIERVFYSGDGDAIPFGPDGLQWDIEYPIYYTRAGTYYPSVHLTDADGNTTVVDLPAVTVLEDRVDPTVTVMLPRLSQRKRISAWQVVRGTARDTGGNPVWKNSVNGLDVHVLQQRKGRWYTYDWDRKRWIRGYAGFALTYNRWWGERAFPRPDAQGRWRTARITGLTRGRLVVRVEAEDTSCNNAKSVQASSRLVRR